MAMTVVQQTMWQDLRSFPLDLPGHPLQFTERLRNEQGWARAYTDRVIGEYRRFLLLAATADDMLVPSDAVDQAWHLHLLDTRAYWDRLCGLVGKPIHHTPSRGGTAERARHRDRYLVTLGRYRDVFGEEPPADIWSPCEQRFAGRCRRVNIDESWVIAKRVPRNVGLAAASALVLAGCSTVTGGVLGALGLLLAFSIVVVLFASRSDAADLRRTRDSGGGGFNTGICSGDSGGGGCGGGSGCG